MGLIGHLLILNFALCVETICLASTVLKITRCSGFSLAVKWAMHRPLSPEPRQPPPLPQGFVQIIMLQGRGTCHQHACTRTCARMGDLPRHPLMNSQKDRQESGQFYVSRATIALPPCT